MNFKNNPITNRNGDGINHFFFFNDFVVTFLRYITGSYKTGARYPILSAN